MPPVFLRRATAPEQVIGPLSPDELAALAPGGDDCVSTHPKDPFVPVDRELDRDGSLRELLLAAFPHAGARRYERWRFALFSGLVPVLTLAALDRELLASGRRTAVASLVIDALFVVACTTDLARRTPRIPAVTAAAFGAAGMRVVLLIAARCGHAPPILIGLAALAAASTAATVWMSPPPRAIADHLRRALAIAPPTRLPSPSSRSFYAYVAYAVLAAAALPFMLFLLRVHHASLPLQLLAFLGFAIAVPHFGRVAIGRELPPLRTAVAQAAGVPAHRFRPGFAVSWRAARRAATAAISMLVLSLALVRGTQHALESAALAHACASDDPAFFSPIQRLVDVERTEVSSEQHAPNLASLLLAVVVVPVAEELVYRGLVQHALRRRVRRRLAIGLAAMLFGLAHLLVYKTVAWQTVLLGLTFGIAYESAGLLASTLVHMLWNLWLSL
jgi:membrane protease YdiL (CAAX protease family)